MQRQRQETLLEQEREKRLAQLIRSQGVADAERELARYEPQSVLPLLVRLLKREYEGIRHRKTLTIGLAIFYLGVVLVCEILNRELSNFPFLAFILAVGGWRDQQKKKALLRIESLATLLTDRIKQAERSELGTLLELAPIAWERTILQIPLRDQLAHLLARTPTDELSLLSPEALLGLRLVTQKAIEEAPHNAFYEPLAIAGLLALGSLKDPRLITLARDIKVAHKCEQVRAAAAEYLEAAAG